MELTRFQKILLAVLAGMLVFFGVLMVIFRTHPGVLFEESLLKITEENGRTVYSGRAHGEPVTISVSRPANFETDVEFSIGERSHDVCTVLYPLEPIRTEHGDTVDGIRVMKNGAVLFEGGYDPEAEFGWYDTDGGWVPAGIRVRVQVSGDPWYGYETTAADAVRFAFGPETAAHGDPALFALAVLFSLLLAARILFWKGLFRFGHRWARDPEPTEGYALLEQIVWTAFAAVTAGTYIAALVSVG